MLALAAIGYLFSHALERSQASGSIVVPLSPAALEGSSRVIGGRAFMWEGDAWREAGAVGEPARCLSAASEEAQEILRQHPDLRELLEDAPRVVLLWRDEVVALVGEASPARP